MCKKQTSVSHSSTEAEIISLDAGLRMDGIPALDLWDSLIEVFHSSPKRAHKARDLAELQGNLSQSTTLHMKNPNPTKRVDLDKTNVDLVPSNVKTCGSSAMLYVFEDNAAVIEMIIKGRSPTMRHLSRTHRVALDWLFDRINLDPKIQIRYIDTKHQLADILTKGTFTRDDLHHLFNICHFSSICCAQNSSLISCFKKMAKRMQEQKDEERIVAKSRPSAMNLSSTVPASSSSAKNLIASSDPGILRASGKPESRVRRNSEPDAASSSQRELKDAYFGGLMDDSAEKPVATDKSHKSLEFSESESWSNHEKEVTVKLVASRNSGNSQISWEDFDRLSFPGRPLGGHLMRSLYRSEKQMHKGHKLITHGE